MVYRSIGIMSGSSLDGLDIAFVEFEESGGSWSYSLEVAECLPYDDVWRARLSSAVGLSALDYQLLHSDYGHYIGAQVNAFMERHGLQYRVGIVASHGHTTFHLPPRMTGQLGCGAAIAAATGLPVVSDLRALDVALGGQGAPIVPMGERLLFPDTGWFLNIGGIANISARLPDGYSAFDVCPANRVLNLLSETLGRPFDEGGRMASTGSVDEGLLQALSSLPYYGQPYPKSLANDFGTDVVMPMLLGGGLPSADALRTFVEHIALEVERGAGSLIAAGAPAGTPRSRMLVTGGGALNTFLVARIADRLSRLGIDAVAAEERLASYKEAIIMALLGVLRWREEETVIAGVTGARRAGVGGALWIG